MSVNFQPNLANLNRSIQMGKFDSAMGQTRYLQGGIGELDRLEIQANAPKLTRRQLRANKSPNNVIEQHKALKEIKEMAEKAGANFNQTSATEKAKEAAKEAVKDNFFQKAWKTIKNNKIASALIGAAAILTIAVGIKHIKENKENKKIASHQG